MAESVLQDVGGALQTNPGEGPGTFQPFPDTYGGAAAPTSPDVAPSGGGGGGGGGRGGTPWSGTFNYNLPGLNRFVAPKFKAPSLEDAMREPGYAFAANAGMDAIQKSAAARGVLRTGGTLKDISKWNQDFAAQRYGDVYNRALSSFDREYQGSKDEYAPTMAEWKAGVDMEKAKAMSEFNAQLEAYRLSNTPQPYHDPLAGAPA